MLICSISHREPTHPVVTRSGILFEQRLIEAYIDVHHTCPVTGEPLSREDLIAIPTSSVAAGSDGAAVPLLPSAASSSSSSIPDMLQRLQTEWDGLMLEQFSLRQQLAQKEWEIAKSQRRHAAAVQVIARMVKEREEQPPTTTSTGSASDDGAKSIVPDDVLLAMKNMTAAQRPAPGEKRARQTNSAAPWKRVGAAVVPTTSPAVAAGTPFITSVTPYSCGEGASVVHGCLDGSLHRTVFHSSAVAQPSSSVVGMGHTDAIHTLTTIHHADGAERIISVALDQTLKIWDLKQRCGDEKATDSSSGSSSSSHGVCEQTIRFSDRPTACSPRSIDDRYFLVAGGTHTPVLYLTDVHRGDHVVEMGLAAEVTSRWGWSWSGHHVSRIESVALHPYGSLAGLLVCSMTPSPTRLLAPQGDHSVVALWDVKAMKRSALLPQQGGSSASLLGASLDFSPNGHELAVGMHNGSTAVWDLRQTTAPILVVPAVVEAVSARDAAAWVAYTSEELLLVASGPQLTWNQIERRGVAGTNANVKAVQQLRMLEEADELDGAGGAAHSVRVGRSGDLIAVGSSHSVSLFSTQ